jgi:hypothetical protein
MYEVSALPPVLVWCQFLGVRPTNWLVPFSLATAIYPAYRMQHSNLTLLISSTSCFSPYLSILASRGLSQHSVLSFPNQNMHLGSVCGETTKLKERVPIIALCRTSWCFPKEIYATKRFWLEEHRKRVRRSDTTWP